MVGVLVVLEGDNLIPSQNNHIQN